MQVDVPLSLVKLSKCYIPYSNKVNWSCFFLFAKTYHPGMSVISCFMRRLGSLLNCTCILTFPAFRATRNVNNHIAEHRLRTKHQIDSRTLRRTILQTTTKRLVRKLVYQLRIVVNSNPHCTNDLLTDSSKTNDDRMTRPPSVLKLCQRTDRNAPMTFRIESS